MDSTHKLHQLIRMLNDGKGNKSSADKDNILFYNERSQEYESDRPGAFDFLIGKYTAFEFEPEKSVVIELFQYKIKGFGDSSKVRLTIKCQIQLINNMQTAAAEWIRNNPDADNAFREMLQKEISRFVKQNTELQESNYLEYEPKLKQYLKNRSQGIGFDVEIEIIPVGEGLRPQDTFKLISKPVACHIRDGKVVVVCTLAMEMQDSRKFIFANISDMAEHFEKFLGHLLQSTFLTKNYAEVLQSFLDNSLQTELEDPVANEARRVGYKVTNLFSIPQIEDFDCKGPFDLSTDNEDSAADGVEFTTSAALVKVRVKVKLRGYVRSFRGAIEHHLRPGVKLKAVMQKEMITRMQLYIGRIKPERFFLYFNEPDPKTSQPCLSADLEKEIRRTLNDSFNVEILDLTITSHHTKLSAEFLRLQNMIGEIVVGDFARMIHYKINYGVLHVDPQSWHIFMVRLSNETAEYKMMAIGETLKNFFETVFNTDPRFRLIRGTHRHFPKLLEAIFQNAQKDIVAAHGVVLQLIGKAPLATEIESGAEQYLKEEMGDRYLKELKSQFKRNKLSDTTSSGDNTVDRLLSDYNISLDNDPRLNEGTPGQDEGDSFKQKDS